MEHALDYGEGDSFDKEDKPNIFNVAASESTKALLHPSAIQALQYLPAYKEWREEVYLLLDLIVEATSSKFAKASFCETYYGIERTSNNLIIPLTELCLIPYLQRKVKTLHHLTRKLRPFEKIITRVAPFVFATYEACNFIIKILYVFTSNVASPSILTLLANIRYKNSRQEGSISVLTPLATIMYALRFLQWWQDRRRSRSTLASKDVPPPPMDLPESNSNEYFDIPGCCPLCKTKDIKIPIALPSARVFCTGCLNSNKEYITSSRCPITGIYVPKGTARTLYIE